MNPSPASTPVRSPSAQQPPSLSTIGLAMLSGSSIRPDGNSTVRPPPRPMLPLGRGRAVPTENELEAVVTEQAQVHGMKRSVIDLNADADLRFAVLCYDLIRSRVQRPYPCVKGINFAAAESVPNRAIMQDILTHLAPIVAKAVRRVVPAEVPSGDIDQPMIDLYNLDHVFFFAGADADRYVRVGRHGPHLRESCGVSCLSDVGKPRA